MRHEEEMKRAKATAWKNYIESGHKDRRRKDRRRLVSTPIHGNSDEPDDPIVTALSLITIALGLVLGLALLVVVGLWS